MIPSLFSEQGRQAMALVLLAIFGSLMLSQLPHERTTWSRFEADYLIDKHAKLEARAASLYREGLSIVSADTAESSDIDWITIDWITYDLCNIGKHAEAEYLLKRALAKIKDIKGKDSPFVALTQMSLARACIGQKKNADAEQFIKDALAIRIKNKDKLAIIESEDWLACHYLWQERQNEAIPHFLKAIELSENWNDTKLRVGLADCYLSTGELSKAESGYQMVLASQDSKSTDMRIRCLLGLGSVFEDRFDFNQAEYYFKAARSLCIQNYGTTNPMASLCISRLASLCREAGRLTEAEQLYRQALSIRLRTTGCKSRETAQSAANLGRVLLEQCRQQEAEFLLRDALAVDQIILGPKHPNTLTVKQNLAVALSDQFKTEESEALFREVIAASLELHGTDHLSVANVMNNFGCLCADQGNMKEAETLYTESLRIRKRLLGENHPDTATSLNNLGSVKRDQKKYEEAVSYFEKAWQINRATLGEEHRRTLVLRDNLLAPYLHLGRVKKAERIAVETIDIARRTQGENSCPYACSLMGLSYVRKAQGKLEEANDLARTAREIHESIAGPRFPWTRDLIGKIAQLHPWWASSSLLKR